MFSGRTEHSLVPFQRGISPHLIWGWKTCKVKKIWFPEAKSLFSTMLARYPPYGPFSLQGEGKTGVPGIDLAIPGALSYHHCNCYILCYIHTCILYVHHQECALGRRGLSRCPRGWAGARTMLTTTQSGHLLMQTLLKIRTHKKCFPSSQLKKTIKDGFGAFRNTHELRMVLTTKLELSWVLEVKHHFLQGSPSFGVSEWREGCWAGRSRIEERGDGRSLIYNSIKERKKRQIPTMMIINLIWRLELGWLQNTTDKKIMISLSIVGPRVNNIQIYTCAICCHF